jgi:D-alanyl-D-alanine carboxypeptidase (penicillin-binding protein 5/6)
MRIEPQIMAPVASGQPLGAVTVSLDGQSIVETELVALDSIVEGGVVQIAKDTVLLWLE